MVYFLEWSFHVNWQSFGRSVASQEHTIAPDTTLRQSIGLSLAPPLVRCPVVKRSWSWQNSRLLMLPLLPTQRIETTGATCVTLDLKRPCVGVYGGPSQFAMACTELARGREEMPDDRPQRCLP
eukprot:2438650-Amphidinium_carterae.1